jgi:hypothetical protein
MGEYTLNYTPQDSNYQWQTGNRARIPIFSIMKTLLLLP